MTSYLTSLYLRQEFSTVFHSKYCYTLLQLRYLQISLLRIKGIQIGDHEIKIVNYADNTSIFLRDITCSNRIQSNFKTIWSCIQLEDKIFKSQALWTGAYKNRTNLPGQMEFSQFSIKILGIVFGNSILDKSYQNKISEGIIKKIHTWNKVGFSLRSKKIIVKQIL